VDDVTIAGQVPLGGNYDTRGGYLEERQTNRAQDGVDFQRYSVTPDYLRLMGIPLTRGRFISDADRVDTPRVMVINETAARAFWPGLDPIGRRVTFDTERKTFVTVVGIVGDVRHYRLDRPSDPQMYMPQEQMTDSYITLAVKTTAFERVLPGIRDAVRSLGPDVPIFDVRSMESLVADSAATYRFTAMLLGVFAVVAAVMTAVGLYAVVAYMVSRRTREFGIRLALGAPKAGIRRLVLGRGMFLTVVGGVVGFVCSIPLTRLLRDQLYETSALDAPAIAIGVLAVIVTGAIAHAVPVARATRVSPTVALRGD
jgi:predicted permease